MPTNDERREVAARLREPFDVLPQGRYYHASHTLFGMGLYTSSEVALRLGVCRLADLIEPEERTCHAVRIAVPFDPRDFPDDLVEVYQFRCSECSVLLEDDWSFCPNCGAKAIQE